MAEETTIFDTFDKDLYRINTPSYSSKDEVSTNGIANISPDQITSGGALDQQNQYVGALIAGKQGFTNTETGYILGIDKGIPKFYIGNSVNYLNWTGTALIIAGDIQASTITGGTFQTASSGQRITINASDNYLKIYNSSGNLIGALGGSTDGTTRMLDLTPETDLVVTRFFAQKTDGTQPILNLTAKGYQTSITMMSESTNAYRTTNNVHMISLINYGTGGAFKYSNNNPDSDGKVFDITQSKVTTTEPIFKVSQGGITETNFRKIFTEVNTGFTIWISDGTNPDGNLTGAVGDACFNGPGGLDYYCDTAGKNWTAK